MLKLLQKLSEISGTEVKTTLLNESISPVDECGSMGTMGSMPSAPHTPASINMTASSGPELTGMLRDLMSLAGVHKVTSDHMPAISTPPTPIIKINHEPDMRKMMDTMNDSVEEEQAEGYDNTPADPTDIPQFDDEEFAYNPNTGDHRERQKGLASAMPVEESTVDSIQKQLFVEYQKFIQQ